MRWKVVNLEHRKISRAVISRLPRYHRYLGDLLEEGVERISSNDLSKKMQVTASQIRQDLNNFGGFGQQGYGYNVKYLYTEIGKILGLDKTHNFIIIGAGNLGQALANYASFERSGFILKSLFDVNPRLEGMSIRGVQVRMMDELVDFLANNEIEIAALTIPKSKAVEVADLLVANGFKALGNFAHTDLTLPKDVVVESVHLSDSLMQLSYNISRRKESRTKEETDRRPRSLLRGILWEYIDNKGLVNRYEISSEWNTDEFRRQIHDRGNGNSFSCPYGACRVKDCRDNACEWD